MVIDTDLEVVGDEAILHKELCIGHVTSGGFAHHAGASVAMGYVRADLAADGTALQVEIDGNLRRARVVSAPLHDPLGDQMRG